jgi:hypothetical protein
MPAAGGSEWLVPTLTTLIGAGLGAGLGAWLAFRNDRARRREEREEREILAAHQLLFAMLQQRQDLNNLQSFVGVQEPDKLLLTAMNATLINKQDLAFVARTHPNDLNDAVMAEHEYLQAIDALSTFNEYTRAVQHFCRENAVGVNANKQVVFEVNSKTSPLFMIDREHKTESFGQLKSSIERGISQNKSASVILRALFRQKFPDEHFHKP